MEKTYHIGWWDCPQCGRKHIYGLDDVCPSCGFEQSKDVDFYSDDTDEYVTEEEIRNYSKSPKWYCSYCGRANRAEYSECQGCGASKDDSSGDYFTRNKKPVETKRTNGEEMPTSTIHDESEDTSPMRFIDRMKFSIPGLALVALLPIIIALCIFFFSPKTKTLHIDDVSWKYTINVSELITFDESNWYLPVGARLQYTRWEYKQTNKVQTGTKTETYTDTERVKTGTERYKSGTRNLGNGIFEDVYSTRDVYENRTVTKKREVPVYEYVEEYATRYYYEIDRWVNTREVVSYAFDKHPYWDDPSLAEKETEAGRTEAYYIYSIDKKGERQQYTVDEDDWSDIQIGDDLKCKVDMFNHVDVIWEDEEN